MKLYFITTNEGKFKEVTESLSEISGLELKRLELEYPEVQADKLEGVVRFGLQWLSENMASTFHEGIAMIEDSGLFVERLKGFPGVYSAYVHNTIKGYDGVLTLMEGEWDRRAKFETVIGTIGKDQNSIFHYIYG